MKKIIIGFLLICLLLSAVFAESVTKASVRKDENIFPIETQVINKKADTYFIYHTINKLEVVNADKKSQKKKLDPSEYTYDKKTGKISFVHDLPYENCIVRTNGIPVIPYSCYLEEFEGHPSELLVILNNLTAVERKDYVYDPKTKLITFRPDIDISHSSYYMVYYVQTANGVVSKTISNDFNDTIAELQARHSQQLFGGPLVVYKDRTGVSLSKVSKEVGFKISLPKPISTYICERYENNQKFVTVYCSYKNKFVECTATRKVEYLQ